MSSIRKEFKVPDEITIVAGKEKKTIKFKDTEPIFYLQVCFSAGLVEIKEFETKTVGGTETTHEIKRKPSTS